MTSKLYVLTHNPRALVSDIASVLNRHGIDARLDLADWELAEMLINYLNSFRDALIKRDEHKRYFQEILGGGK